MTRFTLAPDVVRRPIKDRSAISFDLEFPPSVNNLFANVPGKGRVPTDNYRSWINRAGWEIVANRPGRMPGAVKVTLQFEEKNGRRDLDNLIKPVLDLCVKHRVIDGDHRTVVRAITASWSNSVRGVRVLIEPASSVERSAA